MGFRAPTGYGNQTGLFLPELAKHHDVACSAFYGLQGDKVTWNGITVYPGLGEEFGNSYIQQRAHRHFGSVRGGLVVTLMDVWVLDVQQFARLNTAAICPVDHDPAPPAVERYFELTSAVPIAMSRFGQERLERFDALYVPHMIDTDMYRPADASEVLEDAEIPAGAFVVGMVAANKGRAPSRKSFQQTLEAFKAFQARHDDAYLYLHTTLDHPAGEDLRAMIRSLDVPLEAVRTANDYRMNVEPYTPGEMAQVYSAFDVLVNCAMGEGFGITVMEAQSCGVPTIVTDFSAMREVGCGWKVGYERFFTGQKSWMAMPRVSEMIDALEACYQSDREALGVRAREHVRERYAIPVVMEQHCLPALEQVEQRLLEREPTRLRVAA